MAQENQFNFFAGALGFFGIAFAGLLIAFADQDPWIHVIEYVAACASLILVFFGILCCLFGLYERRSQKFVKGTLLLAVLALLSTTVLSVFQIGYYKSNPEHEATFEESEETESVNEQAH
ncbi:MAG: hypothetical protein AAFV59_09840 [Pseudomonadota bacterium]